MSYIWLEILPRKIVMRKIFTHFREGMFMFVNLFNIAVFLNTRHGIFHLLTSYWSRMYSTYKK